MAVFLVLFFGVVQCEHCLVAKLHECSSTGASSQHMVYSLWLTKFETEPAVYPKSNVMLERRSIRRLMVRIFMTSH